VPSVWSLDIAIAPDGALRLVASAINRPKKRAFGVLKTENEYVGFILGDSFEIWERRGRAVHARGSVGGRRGGTRVAVRFALPAFTKVLVGLFFVLYALAAAGIATRPPGTGVSAVEILIALAGAGALAAVFAAGAARQRADLSGFLERTFSEVPRL
jgi:hypothetical protein